MQSNKRTTEAEHHMGNVLVNIMFFEHKNNTRRDLRSCSWAWVTPASLSENFIFHKVMCRDTIPNHTCAWVCILCFVSLVMMLAGFFVPICCFAHMSMCVFPPVGVSAVVLDMSIEQCEIGWAAHGGPSACDMVMLFNHSCSSSEGESRITLQETHALARAHEKGKTRERERKEIKETGLPLALFPFSFLLLSAASGGVGGGAACLFWWACSMFQWLGLLSLLGYVVWWNLTIFRFVFKCWGRKPGGFLAQVNWWIHYGGPWNHNGSFCVGCVDVAVCSGCVTFGFLLVAWRSFVVVLVLVGFV